MNLRQVYSSLLRLYPRDHRAIFGDEMLDVFNEVREECALEGSKAVARWVVRELAGLLSGAMREWHAKLAYGVRHTNSYITGRGLPDRLFMRPAGVGWEAFYRGRTCRGGLTILTGSEQAGSLLSQAGACVNALQRFEFASPPMRLLLSALGHSCRCTVRNQMEHGLDEFDGSDGSEGTRGGIAN